MEDKWYYINKILETAWNNEDDLILDEFLNRYNKIGLRDVTREEAIEFCKENNIDTTQNVDFILRKKE